MKKWDERYFVLTTQRLYYFKTMEVRPLPRAPPRPTNASRSAPAGQDVLSR